MFYARITRNITFSILRFSPPKKQGVIPQSNSWEGVDFTPKTQTLQSNQRIHLQQRNPEHEDALDILSLLVERSLSMDDDKPALERSISNVHQLQEDLQTLRELSSKHPNHSSHMQTLDSLLASHTYALEMKRAAFSASTWLKSTQRDSEEKLQQLNEELSKCRAEIGRLKSKEEIRGINFEKHYGAFLIKYLLSLVGFVDSRTRF